MHILNHFLWQTHSPGSLQPISVPARHCNATRCAWSKQCLAEHEQRPHSSAAPNVVSVQIGCTDKRLCHVLTLPASHTYSHRGIRRIRNAFNNCYY